jgi:hypothetical protein
VLTYDKDDEDDATSLDAMSVSTTGGGVSTQTTQRPNKNQKNHADSKLDEQINEDLKSIDDRRKSANKENRPIFL